MWVHNSKGGMRQFLSSFILLGYNLLLSFVVGCCDCDLELCDTILKEKLALYPDGAFFKFFKGRYIETYCHNCPFYIYNSVFPSN